MEENQSAENTLLEFQSVKIRTYIVHLIVDLNFTITLCIDQEGN